LIAAAGDQPDVSGVWANDVIDLADNSALISLDEFSGGNNLREERYLPVYWKMGVYEGRLFGVPSTPGVTGLHWNKAAFRAAGLDPERPPQTLAELDEYAEKLTIIRDGRIEQIGFLPSRPPWWPFFWVYFHDGQLWDGGANITLDSLNNVKAFEWVRGHAEQIRRLPAADVVGDLWYLRFVAESVHERKAGDGLPGRVDVKLHRPVRA
jgi:ABC-type glycerol-3-phosphate transport system substrate-binding protein